MACAVQLLHGISTRAQSADTIKHLPPKQIEVTAPKETGQPKETSIQTVNPRLAQTKPAHELIRETGSAIASDALLALSSSLDMRKYGSLGGISIPSFRGLP